MLLEQVFPAARRQLVTIVINPLGQSRHQELGRVEEYAYFLFFGDAQPAPVMDDLLNAATSGTDTKPRWERLLRGGTDSDRANRPRMFYPVFIEPESKRIVSVGDALPADASRHDVAAPDGQVAVWPVRTNGTEGRWRLQSSTLRTYVDEGVAKVGNHDRTNDRWTLLYLGDAMRRRIADGDIVITGKHPDTGAVNVTYANATSTIAKTVWSRGTHRAGEYGSRVLSDFLGERRFPFPKSIYAVADTLRIAIGDRPDALVVDFFAGSGTTFHATALLNREDDGRRSHHRHQQRGRGVAGPQTARCRAPARRRGVRTSTESSRPSLRPGCEAAVSGQRPDRKPVEGRYLTARRTPTASTRTSSSTDWSTCDPDDVELGRAFRSIHPLLWLTAGARSARYDTLTPEPPYVVLPEGGYAVLFDERAFASFIIRAQRRPRRRAPLLSDRLRRRLRGDGSRPSASASPPTCSTATTYAPSASGRRRRREAHAEGFPGRGSRPTAAAVSKRPARTPRTDGPQSLVLSAPTGVRQDGHGRRVDGADARRRRESAHRTPRRRSCG